MLYGALNKLLGAVYFIIAVKAFEPEASGQLAVLRLLEQRSIRERLVIEDRPDLINAVRPLDLLWR